MVKLIPHSKQGHGLMVFCNKCKKRQSNSNHCNHKNKWKYKTDFKIDGKRYPRVLQSDNLEDAFHELIEIKKSIKEPKPTIQLISKEGYTIYEGMEKYFQKVLCLDEFEMNSPKSKDHQNECIRVVQRFGESLTELGIDITNTNLEQLNTSVIKTFQSNLKNKYNVNPGPGMDKHTRIMRHFFSTLKKANMYSSNNLFGLIETAAIEPNNTSIKDEEFERLLAVINVESGWGEIRGRRRNHFTRWIKDAFIIARLTGLRREEICNLQWSNIIKVEGTKFFHVIDLKTTKRKGKTYFKVAPITDELLRHLEQIRPKSESNYILDTGLKESTFKDNMSRAFTHFFKIAHPKDIQKHFKHLRKSHITELKSILGDRAYLASGHSGDSVIEKHYIDRIAAVIKFSKFKNQINSDLQLN